MKPSSMVLVMALMIAACSTSGPFVTAGPAADNSAAVQQAQADLALQQAQQLQANAQAAAVIETIATPEPGPNGSAAAQQARADYALQQAQQLEANAHAAAINETAQAQAASDVQAVAAAATAQALGVARAQLALTADALNFPSTQAAQFAQQTAQALKVKATVDAWAMLLAQQQAQATATAQAISAQLSAQALEVNGTLDARAMLLAQQQAQATATAQAMSGQQTEQAIEVNATLDARAALLARQQTEVAATAQAMELEGVTAEQVAGAAQQQREWTAWLVPIMAAIAFALVLLLGAKFISGLIDAANERRRLEIHRLSMMGRLLEAPAETIVFADHAQTGFGPPPLLSTPGSGNGYDASPAPPIDLEAPPVVVILPPGDKGLADRAEAREEAARCKLAMKLLRDAIDHVGAQSNRIPPAAQLTWPAWAWTIAVAILRPYGVEVLPGQDGGTFLVGQYSTLQALYIAMGDRRLTLYPAAGG